MPRIRVRDRVRVRVRTMEFFSEEVSADSSAHTKIDEIIFLKVSFTNIYGI